MTASSTYQERVDRNGDRTAMQHAAYRARLRLGDLEARCAGAETRIRAAQSRLDALPAYERGWLLEVIGLLALVSIVLEWYPARMMSLVFFFASAVELVALTAAFAIGGFLLGLLLGELLRRHRRPQAHEPLDWVFLVAAIVAVGAFLVVGYELRLGYARASNRRRELAAGAGRAGCGTDDAGVHRDRHRVHLGLLSRVGRGARDAAAAGAFARAAARRSGASGGDAQRAGGRGARVRAAGRDPRPSTSSG